MFTYFFKHSTFIIRHFYKTRAILITYYLLLITYYLLLITYYLLLITYYLLLITYYLLLIRLALLIKELRVTYIEKSLVPISAHKELFISFYDLAASLIQRNKKIQLNYKN